MAQFVVRNIDNGLKLRLQRRARRNGRSMEEEVRDILRSAVNCDESPDTKGLGTDIAALFVKAGIDFDIPELGGYRLRPLSFEQ